MRAPTDIVGALRTQNHAMCVPMDRNDDTCVPIEQYHSVNDTVEPLPIEQYHSVNDTETIRYLVNAPLGSKGMPLHVAIRCGRLQSAITLIDAKCDVSSELTPSRVHADMCKTQGCSGDKRVRSDSRSTLSPHPVPHPSHSLAQPVFLASLHHAVPDTEGVLAIQVAVQQPDFALYKLVSEQYPPGTICNILDKE